MKLIPLTKGQFAKVDDEDYEFLMQWKWHSLSRKIGFYASRSDGSKERKRIWMHRVIMNTPDYLEVDHIDHDTLNNQKYNLRNVTRPVNQMNQLLHSDNTTGVAGVSLRNGKFQVRISLDSVRMFLGDYPSIDEATAARQQTLEEFLNGQIWII